MCVRYVVGVCKWCLVIRWAWAWLRILVKASVMESSSGRAWRWWRCVGVIEAVFDGGRVGVAGWEPGGVGVAYVVRADFDGGFGGFEGGLPDVAPAPFAGG